VESVRKGPGIADSISFQYGNEDAGRGERVLHTVTEASLIALQDAVASEHFSQSCNPALGNEKGVSISALLLWDALTSIHPGLSRYVGRGTLEKGFE
jgi:hypothetical protein